MKGGFIMKINANVYNHLSTSLVPKKRNTTHKSSDLKSVYNNITKYNKNSPLYLLKLSESKQEHMINIKEAAITLTDVAENFSNHDSFIHSQKMLHSDNEDSVTGSFKNRRASNLPDELSIRIDSLATEQTNIGTFVNSTANNLYSKEHQFTLETLNDSARFSISVSPDESNITIQKKLVQYINNRNIGITASLITEGPNSAIKLSSLDTGFPETDDGLHFRFIPNAQGQNIVDVFGLNQTTIYPTNSTFEINGESHTATSNHISINQAIELDFHKPSSSPVNISLVQDTESALLEINSFAESYNNLIDLSTRTSNSIGSRNLLNDIAKIATRHKNEFESVGLLIDEELHMTLNEDIIKHNIINGKITELFGNNTSLKDDITSATSRLTLDPVAYVNKLIVTYPNAKNSTNPTYTQSLYSGLMYNNYA